MWKGPRPSRRSLPAGVAGPSRGAPAQSASAHAADCWGDEMVVIELNRQAIEHLAGKSRLEIVHGASHLFEEPGTLEQVARLARDWFWR
jgi:hypothetical protein